MLVRAERLVLEMRLLCSFLPVDHNFRDEFLKAGVFGPPFFLAAHYVIRPSSPTLGARDCSDI
jgi:hypothetical protein